MKFSEEQMKDIVSLKENLIGQIEEHQKAIEMLEKNLIILDLTLKESSFTKASQLVTENKPQMIKKTEAKSSAESIPIKRGNDGKTIANAYITTDQLSIVLDKEIELDADTPPFKSFFIDRIIGEMKRKDFEDAENGKIQKESVINYIINKNGTDIREIIIKNYRQKERANELINTAGWSLTRMLENVKK